MQGRRDAIEDRKDSEHPHLVVCIFGYSQIAKQIYDSFRQDKILKVYLVTKSIIERQRAENDGKQAIELESIIGEVDFWILLTPFDGEVDFRNSSEENL